MRIAAGERQQQRDRRAERGDLREREVDEDDAALDDVHAEVGVDAGQDQARDERRREELDGSSCPSGYFAPVALIASTSRLTSVVEQLEVVATPAARRRPTAASPATLRAALRRDRVRRLRVEVRLDHDDLDVLRLHRVDDVERVLRRRRNPGLRLDVADDVEAERVGEVRPGPMVGDRPSAPCRAPSAPSSAAAPRSGAARSPPRAAA